MIKTEVLVVGGGPAGATTGRFLSERGIENIIIHRNCEYRKPCGGGIRYTTFDEFEIEKDIAHSTVKKIEIGFKNKKIKIDISEHPILIVDRKKFDKYLRLKAKEKGSNIIEGLFLDFKNEKGYIVSTIRTHEKEVKIRSRYLVAADGVNSTIRKKIFGRYPDRISVQYIDLKGKKTETCSFFFGNSIAYKYYGWVFPHFDGVNIGTYRGKLKNFLGYLNIDVEKKPKGFFLPIWKEKEVFFKDNIFFVGDSAGQVTPFTFEGIYPAMKSGKILADVLGKGKKPEEYAKQWNKIFYNQFSTLKKLHNIFSFNEIGIYFLMRLFENRYIQKEMIKLWLGKREVKVDLRFILRTIRRIF